MACIFIVSNSLPNLHYLSDEFTIMAIIGPHILKYVYYSEQKNDQNWNHTHKHITKNMYYTFNQGIPLKLKHSNAKATAKAKAINKYELWRYKKGNNSTNQVLCLHTYLLEKENHLCW